MSTVTVAQPRAGALRSPRLLIGLGLFSLGGFGVVTLAPAIAVAEGSGSQPDFPLIAGTGAALILIAGIFLAQVGRVLGLGRAWLLLAALSNAALITYRFVVVPTSFYATTFTLGPYFALDPNSVAGFACIALVGVVAAALVVLVTYAMVHPRARNATTPDRRTSNRMARRVRNLLTALVVAVALIVSLPFLGMGVVYTGAMEIPTALRVAGACVPGLAIAWLFAGAGSLATASARPGEIRDASAVAALLWVSLALLLIIHVLWVVYMGVLIHLMPFKTVTQTK
jgi:uncharacterized membrane protein